MINGQTVNNNLTFSILNIIYPVGCFYYSTTATCPLAAFFGTWQNVGTKILTDVSSATSVACKGNGLTLGVTDGTNNAGLQASNDSNITNAFCGNGTGYGRTVGTTVSASHVITRDKLLGFTTDSSKSGIVAITSNLLGKTSITVNIFKRTA